jgi:hypothetical protein
MGSAVDVIAMIRSFFPDRQELIERVFWADAEFRVLCRDYQACHAVLERLRREDPRDTLRRHREYADLLDDLGAEIRRWPDDHPPGAAGDHRAPALDDRLEEDGR